MTKKVGGGEITFYIEEWWNDPMLREYKALPGMTWGEWVNSSYNTGGYGLYASNYIVNEEVGFFVGKYLNIPVFKTDVIEEITYVVY